LLICEKSSDVPFFLGMFESKLTGLECRAGHVRTCTCERTEAFISDMYVLYHPEFDSTEETATMTSEAIYCSEPPNVFIYHEETKDDIPKN
jgi:hypothetical protein